MVKEPLTPAGFKKLSDELENLTNVKRGEVAREIQEARELGDLKENAEYHAAKEKQGLMEAHIAKLEDISGRTHVIDPTTLPHSKVSFGSTVVLLDLETEIEKKYTIVGGYESKVEKGYISYHSPLSKILLGKEEGEEITAKLPGGEVDYEILEVKYEEIVLD